MNALTPPQATLLEYLRAHHADLGWMPTVSEIREHFGWKSDNGPMKHLVALEKKGFILRHRGKNGRQISRAITLIDRSPLVNTGYTDSTPTV